MISLPVGIEVENIRRALTACHLRTANPDETALAFEALTFGNPELRSTVARAIRRSKIEDMLLALDLEDLGAARP